MSKNKDIEFYTIGWQKVRIPGQYIINKGNKPEDDSPKYEFIYDEPTNTLNIITNGMEL